MASRSTSPWKGFCGDYGFWEPSLLNSTRPDISPCFQETVLSWIPLLFLWLVAPFYFRYMQKHDRGSIPISHLHRAKTVFGGLLIIVPLGEVAYAIAEVIIPTHQIAGIYLLTPTLVTLTMILAFIIMQVQRIKGVQTSWVLFIFWLLSAVCGIVEFISRIYSARHRDQMQFDLFHFATFYFYYALVLAKLVCSSIVDRRPYSTTDTNPCPESSVSFLSRLTFWWFSSMVVKGYKRSLTSDDLWSLLDRDKAAAVMPRFLKTWKKEKLKSDLSVHPPAAKQKKMGSQIPMQKLEESGDGHRNKVDEVAFSGTPSQNTKKPEKHTSDTDAIMRGYKASLFKTIARTFGRVFLIGCFLKLLHDILLFVSPQILRGLIRFTADKGIYQWEGYMYACLLFVCTMIQSSLLHQYFHICMLTGMQLRTALIGAVYRKALILTNSARKDATTGEIVNLMSVDAQRLMELCTFVNTLWSSPFQILVALFFLWRTLGPSVLAGYGAMALMIPLNAYIAIKIRGIQARQMKEKDARLKLMNEVLSGIKVLKLYAWETAFRDKVMEIRNREVRLLRMSSYLQATMTFMWTSAPFIVALLSFTVYVFVDEENVLDAEKVFVSISLFNILKFPFSMLPSMISRTMMGHVSLKRLETFLMKDELDTKSVERFVEGDHALHINDGSFAWSRGDNLILKNINVKIQPGSLVAVVGQVGCGKSSLLSALLGEMEKISGTVNVNGSVAYVPQQAWIQNATLRSNVMFGAPMHETEYQRVIEGCALAPDLEILPAGDLTEIGEKGINLSGGQKQRVSLARAVYNDADVYLLDDPLSAVDSHVGKHIFDKVIGPQGLLKNKTRVLVTHGISFLPQVDHIIVLVDGEITEVGSYAELLSHNQAFAEFLRNYSNEAEDAEENLPGDVETKAADGSPSHREASPTKISTALKSHQEEEALKKKISEDQLKKQREQDATKAALAKEGDTLIKKETSETGMTRMRIFILYIRSLGNFLFLLIFLLYALFNADAVFINVWLSRWSSEELVNGTTPEEIRDKYLGVYGFLVFLQGVLLLLAAMLLAMGVLKASRSLYLRLLTNVLRSPMSFFDTTPTGRILNRFSKDTYTIDESIPFAVASFLRMFMLVVATFIVITWSTPIFAVVIVPVIICFALLQRFYVATSRQLNRIESVARSPIYAHFSESIAGATSIRAYDSSERFINQNQNLVDVDQIAYYPTIISNRWLGIRLEFLGSVLVFFASMFAVIGRDSLSSGIVGLSISYALEVTSIMTMLVRGTCNLENHIVAVERVEEYCNIPTEAPEVVESNRPASSWPDTGKVEVNRYSVRYRDDLDLVLREISCHIEPGEKLGIVGRTGAGKSSLSMALFRILEAAAGSIKIDDVDVSTIGLHDLRSRITIIPQDPVLFAGTLRMNLDPLDQYPDDLLWDVLKHSHLQSFVSELPEKLQFNCTEGGKNLSLGQRQLICLARALLRKTKILVLDEATAAVDLETDDLIQATIRTEFAECTVITIAHRLNTIMDSTRILVLDAGEIAEFDTPNELLKRGGIFHCMARDAGLI
ncbi:multidrug resistance-associated protein 1-like [Patiria miniata]|uniref:Multidrug resistance-associated protein 1 n=1 Tax=Patiria miniata TaxID=46514 RepID=A0A914AJI4_PATMI|nr:multidrug resistance-associated protein 1-like [Patiria miniata]